MRKKHSKTKSLEFQRSRDGVVLTIWTGLFILPGRLSKSQGIFYLFGSNGKKIGKNDHYMHRWPVHGLHARAIGVQSIF